MTRSVLDLLLRRECRTCNLKVGLLNRLGRFVEGFGTRFYRGVIVSRSRLAAVCQPQLVCIVDFELVQKVDISFGFARIGQVNQGDALPADPEQSGAAYADEVVVGPFEVRPERSANFLQPLLWR